MRCVASSRWPATGGYAAGVIERLNALALRGHNQLHGARRKRLGDSLAAGVRAGFPAAIRRHWRPVLLAHLLFYGPYLAMFAAVLLQPRLAGSVLDPQMLDGLDRMYDPSSDQFLQERPSDSDPLMFGFYIKNNIGIAFRCYAGGALAGLGSLFYLLYNGLVLGAAVGHVQAIGRGSTFWPFVATHSAFELTAIVLSGAAGLMLAGPSSRPVAARAPGRCCRRPVTACLSSTAPPGCW